MSKVSTIRAIIDAHKGQFFSVEFVKKDGSTRTIKNAQVGIKKQHQGENTVSHIEKYVTVIENLGQGKYNHRNVNIETINRLAIAGVEFKF